jgi:hypothetical protein
MSKSTPKVPAHGCHFVDHGRLVHQIQDFITEHVCRNREDPIGYKVSFVQFDGNGSPTAAANSTTAAVDVVSNPDLSKCPDNCFRPAGLAWDSQGRLFFSSDATGEIYVITREDGTSVNSVTEVGSNGTSSGGGSGTGNSAAPSPTASSGAAVAKGWEDASLWVVGAAAVALAL